jgi:hypothetical protein
VNLSTGPATITASILDAGGMPLDQQQITVAGKRACVIQVSGSVQRDGGATGYREVSESGRRKYRRADF